MDRRSITIIQEGGFVKLLKKQIDAQWFQYPQNDYVSVRIRPFPLSKIVFADGAMDPVETAKKRFIYCLTDWTGIVDDDDKPVPCTEDIKADIFDFELMETELLIFIRDKINEATNAIEDIPGN